MGDESIFLKMSDKRDENEGLNQEINKPENQEINKLPLPIKTPADGFSLDDAGSAITFRFPKQSEDDRSKNRRKNPGDNEPTSRAASKLRSQEPH